MAKLGNLEAWLRYGSHNAAQEDATPSFWSVLVRLVYTAAGGVGRV